MLIPAKVEYGMQAMLALAAFDQPATSETLSKVQDLPPRLLNTILNDLRVADLVVSQRGPVGGYRLARPSDSITIAEVIRALGGPLAQIRGARPEDTAYSGAATHLKEVWMAMRTSLSSVLENVTLEDVVLGRFSPSVGSPSQ